MNEQQHDMTGAWALNALDDAERARFEEYLAHDPAAGAEARSFAETAGELARGLDPESPRPELKRSLMAQISQTRQLPPLTETGSRTDSAPDPAPDTAAARHHTTEPDRTAEPGSPVIPLDRYRSRTRWLAVAAAALMITTIAGFGLWGGERAAQQENRATIAAMESSQAQAQKKDRMVSTIMTSDDAAQMTIPSQGGGSLHLMYSRDQQALLVQPAGLPALPADSTYQLWLIDPATGAESAGMLTPSGDAMMVHHEMGPEVVLGLTIEPAGGSEQPTTEPIAGEAL